MALPTRPGLGSLCYMASYDGASKVCQASLCYITGLPMNWRAISARPHHLVKRLRRDSFGYQRSDPAKKVLYYCPQMKVELRRRCSRSSATHPTRFKPSYLEL